MAGGAGSRNRESLLEHGLAVNTFGVVCQDVVLVDVPRLLYSRAFLMAIATDEWNPQRSYGGALILDRHNIVIAMAVHATRRQLIATRSRFAVQGLGIQFLLLRVAGSAADLRGLAVRQILAFKIGMATGTAYLAMNRG
jgi:hypothetical protein